MSPLTVPPRSLRRPLGLLALLAALAACSIDAPPSAPDAEATPDAVSDDAPPADAPPADAPRAADAGAVADAPDGPCAAGALIDLDLHGARVGDVTSYLGTNHAAPVRSDDFGPCGGRPTSVVGFRYTVRSRSRLVVSTFHAETGIDLDTVVWARRGCSADAPSLGCNDDVGGAYGRRENPVAARFHSYFSTAALEPGATVDVFVGTYAPSLGTPPTGTFRLTVTETDGRAGGACDPDGASADDPLAAGCAEGTRCRPSSDDLSDFRCLAPLAVGAPCDPRGVRNVCDALAFCRGTGAAARCEPRGRLGGQCREGAPRCGDGLSCSVYNTCAAVVPEGGSCASTGSPIVCAPGTSCSSFEDAQRCRRPGALGGPCREAPDACDAGLACGYSVCVPALPLGAACDPSGSRSACADGHCPFTTSRCTPLGTRDAPCRGTGPACDAGLRCNAGACVPAAPVGGSCDGSGSRRPTSVCVEGAVCPYGAESRCVLAGLAGSPCRYSETPCDAGLACGSAQRCVARVAPGAPCDARGAENVCAPGSHCLAEGAAARCLADGANGRSCRSSGTACDEGLLCAGGLCRPRVEVGGLCDPSGVMGACVPSSDCLTTDGVSRCAAYGTLRARCEIAWSCPSSSTCGRCRDGLDCGASFTCVPEVAVGGRCDPARVRDGCGLGAACITERGESRCVTDGTRGGACARGAAAVCAPGLRCDAMNRCVPGVAQGAKCDPTGRLGACAGGTSCRRRGDASYCLPDGARGAAVRSAWPPCDEGLVALGGICVEGLPPGSPCDILYRANACAPGASCVRGEGGDRCVADGVVGGRCRSRGARCDAGLGCDANSWCATGLPVGSACDPTRRADVCVVGASCRAGAGGARCVVDGVLEGGCRDEEPRCDGGLACAGPGVCRPALLLGAPCDLHGGERACPSGALCIDGDGGPRCFATGAAGGYCRSPSARCDEGFACGAQFRCRATVALGERCDVEGRDNACALGSSCLALSGASRCVADGARDGACRAGAARCDAGLSCAPDSASAFPQRRCVAAIPLNGACDPSRAAFDRCVDGAVCVGVGASGSCVRAGYAVAPSTERFIDACAAPGATVLTMGPSLPSLPATLPFAFSYFGVERPAGSVITVGSGGWLRFGATALRDAPPDELPTLFLDDTVFALWTRSTLGLDTAAPGRLCLATTGAAPSRVFVVTWNGLTTWGDPSSSLRVELQLREGSRALDVLYRLSPTGASDPSLGATIGLQGLGATAVVQVCGGTGRTATPCTRAHLRDLRFSP